MDDMIFWEHLDKVCQYITHCAKNGITFNKEKFCFGRNEVEYLRLMLTKGSMKPSQDIPKDRAEFPERKEPTRVRSWYGPRNQVSRVEVRLGGRGGPEHGLGASRRPAWATLINKNLIICVDHKPLL